MTEENIYFKQEKLFNPNNKQPHIHIYGVGSIGSHVTIGLAKTGLENINIYDYDELESDNLPAQFYPHIHGFDNKTNKVDIMKDFCKDMTGTTIEINNVKITEETELKPTYDSIHIVCFDNIEGRKIIFEKLKGFPVHYIDGRIGAFNLEKYSVNMNEDMEMIKEYDKTLIGEFTELECGEKCLWAVNSMIASKIIADVIKITKEEKPTYNYKTNLMSDISISKKGE